MANGVFGELVGPAPRDDLRRWEIHEAGRSFEIAPSAKNSLVDDA